jgi:hypothetical protein
MSDAPAATIVDGAALSLLSARRARRATHFTVRGSVARRDGPLQPNESAQRSPLRA